MILLSSEACIERRSSRRRQAQGLLQRLGSERRPWFAAADEEGEDVAVMGRLVRQPLRPRLDAGPRIAGRLVIRAAHQPGVDEVRCRLIDKRIYGMVGEADGHAPLPG